MSDTKTKTDGQDLETSSNIVEPKKGQARLAEKLHESEARFRNTVENIPLNLVVYDREYRVLYLNPALAAICARICNEPPEALTNKRGAEIWPAPIWEPLRTHTERAIETRERQTYELDMTLPGQSRVVRQWTVVPLFGPDGEVNEILAMSHDVTAQRRLVDELREADRRKSEFIAVLSHELRNPLAAIQSSLYVLERAAPDSQQTSLAKTIVDRQVGQLVRIVDDLLDVTRITQNKFRLRRERLDVNELVSQTIADNRSHLERGGVGLEAKAQLSPIYVNADRARLAQVVTNLLSNAVKFTPAGGSATVSVVSDAASAQAVIIVSDTGTGIEPALLERLFQPFAQADRTLDLSRGGLGLGLALVKGLVELHGGEVSARSEGRGKGTEITVRLPLATDTSTEAAPVVRDDRRATPRRVLLVEDEPDIAGGLFETLSMDGHEVQIARTGAEALAKVMPFKPDVVFCDIGLPGMNGYEIARRLRANPALGATLLVALSGYAQPEDVEKARDAGFDEHLPKPASMHRIRRILAAPPTSQNGDPPTDP